MTRFKKLKEKIEKDETSNDVTFKELTKYLNHYGYFLVRVKGSHHAFKNICGDTIIIPIHGNYIKKCYVKNIALMIKEENNE